MSRVTIITESTDVFIDWHCMLGWDTSP